MNNRVLLAALAGGVAMFFGGWVIFGMLLMNTMNEMNPGMAASSKEPMVMWALALSNIIWALFYALIFDRWAGISTLKSGAIAGAWMTAMIGLAFDLSLFSMTNMITLNWAILDILPNAVLGAVSGAVIGWVLGYKRGA